MKIYNHHVELIFELPPYQWKAKGEINLKKQLSDAEMPVEAITTKAAKLPKSKKAVSKAMTMGAAPEKLYVKTGIRDAEMNPWDVAHLSSKAVGAQTAFIEPDLLQEFVVDTNMNAA